MMESKKCPECGGGGLYRSENVSASGGDGLNFLPGLGDFFSYPKFHIVLCKDCGLTRFFAAREALSKLSDSKKWTRL